jgi:hypothetical protein
VNIPAALVLESSIRRLLEPTFEVVEGRLAGKGGKRVVLFTGLPGDPRRPLGTLAAGVSGVR